MTCFVCFDLFLVKCVQKYLVDIVPTACHMLAMDAEPDVRRSAAYLLAELVAGTEETFWEVWALRFLVFSEAFS